MKVLGALALLASSVAVAAPVSFQLPAPNSQASPKSQAPASSLKSAIDDLGKFDDAARVQAAKTIRRAPAGPAVAALIEAATTHRDSYVRFRALVLLSGFNDPRARDIMSAALDDPNDRLRTVAYGYFEHNREHGMAPRLLKALNKEEGEFVRPALTRALAAYADDPAVPPVLSGLVMRGEDLFRSAVIEAIGDYHGAYALSQLTAVARQDGPLQEDAVLALGKIGDQHALGVLEELQKSAPRGRQPAVAAAICLLGVNCESHETFISDTARFAIQNSGYQELLRAAARSLGTLAEAGHAEAAVTLLDLGIPARDPARSPVALALGAVALRNTPLIVKVLGSRGDLRDCALLLRDAFDMLEEDYAQERFFATVRRSYWQAAAGTSDKKVADTLIQVLEFYRVDYRQAGVDIDAGNEVVRRIRGLASGTFTKGVLSHIGSFGGLFHLGSTGLRDAVLVSSADGVGTKLRLAFLSGVHSTIGRDLVNHCVNDILVQGAEPLFFLDYLATGRLDPDVAVEIVDGLARGCRENGCALLGGETAEMPGFYADGEYDVAGFIVGAVERDRLIDGKAIAPGDALIGLPSSGLHTNGYSLARSIVFDRLGLSVESEVPEIGGRVGDVLLTPHRSYLAVMRPLLAAGVGFNFIKGMAHITGGGITDNLPRILPPGTSAAIDQAAWEIPAVFRWLESAGGVPRPDMLRTFNMGIGLIVAVDAGNAARACALLREAGEPGARVIGRVESTAAAEPFVRYLEH